MDEEKGDSDLKKHKRESDKTNLKSRKGAENAKDDPDVVNEI